MPAWAIPFVLAPAVSCTHGVVLDCGGARTAGTSGASRRGMLLRVLARVPLALLLALPSCALSHELGTHPSDAGPSTTDFGVAHDLGVARDLGVTTDAGTDAGSCGERWAALPYCPADPSMAIGQPCPVDGQNCGACCLPGPALACIGGVWTLTEPPDCRGILCPAFPRCGTGECAPDAICVHVSTDIRESDRCAIAPFTPHACSALPDGWLSDDPRTCQLCTCADVSFPIGNQLDVQVSCPCCD